MKADNLHRPPALGADHRVNLIRRRIGKAPQELAFELEKYAGHLRDREDHLTVRDIQKKRLPHPFSDLS